MNKGVLKQMVVISMLLCPLFQFSQHPDKKEIAEKNLLSAHSNAKLSHQSDSATDRERFKKKAQIKIKGIETDIEKLKAREVYKNEVAQQNYTSKVLSFEKQKNELSVAVLRSGEISKPKWPAFKKELNTLLDALASEVKNLRLKSK